MDNRVEMQVQNYLPRDVDQEVSQHLGTFAAQTSAAGGASTDSTERRRSVVSASELLQELRSPGGVRRAIMMREILERPLALRRSRR